MKPMTDSLGKRLSAQDVAEYLRINVNTVRKYREQLGGIKVGRRILFFENLIVDAIKEKSYAVQKTGKEQDGMGSRCDAQRKEVLQDIPHQSRSDCMGIGNKNKTRRKLDDPFGLIEAN